METHPWGIQPLICIQGSKNIAADALSRLDMVCTPNPVKNNFKSVNEYYRLEDHDISHPTNLLDYFAKSTERQRFDKNRLK